MKRRALLVGIVGVLLSGFSSASAASKKPTPKASAKPKVTKKSAPTPKATKVSTTPKSSATPTPQELLVTVEGLAIQVESIKPPTSLYATVTKNGREYPLLIAMPTDRTLKIFTARCPHQGSILNLAQGSEFRCDLHGARFAEETGKVLDGPTVNSLDQFEPIIKNGMLFISL